ACIAATVPSACHRGNQRCVALFDPHWGPCCHIKHILAADVKHIVAPQQQYARGARCALETQIGVVLGCYAEPRQRGLVRPLATLCFMRWPLYTLCDTTSSTVY